ncbi:hypothetical protein KAI65_04125 [Candidatus Parcubacteria bacterium]|nr:hypothetical protein [Candidatus Parcubacteria bacterium]
MIRKKGRLISHEDFLIRNYHRKEVLLDVMNKAVAVISVVLPILVIGIIVNAFFGITRFNNLSFLISSFLVAVVIIFFIFYFIKFNLYPRNRNYSADDILSEKEIKIRKYMEELNIAREKASEKVEKENKEKTRKNKKKERSRAFRGGVLKVLDYI